MKWEKYLQVNTLAGDIDKSLEQHSNSINSSISNASQHIIDSNIASLVEINAVLQHGFDNVVDRVDRVGESVESLRADFNFAIGEVLWKLELIQETLTGILQEVRLAEFEREARSFRMRAEDAYENGWYKESLSDFLEAVKRNYQDFAVLFSIANIYLYHCTEYDDDYKEPGLEKALAYYLKSAKYSTPKSKKHAAKSYLFSGWTCYLLEKDNEALDYTSKAIELNPDLAEAYFQKAKFLMCLDLPDKALVPLRKAIGMDRDYSIRACMDDDFKRYKNKVQGLLDEIRTEAQKNAQKVLDCAYLRVKQMKKLSIGKYFLKDFDIDEIKIVSSTIKRAKKAFSSGTLYGYLDSILLSSDTKEAIDQVVNAFTQAVEASKRKAIEDAGNEIKQIDTKILYAKEKLKKKYNKTSSIFRVISLAISLPLGFSSCLLIQARAQEYMALYSLPRHGQAVLMMIIAAPLSWAIIVFVGVLLASCIAKNMYNKSSVIVELKKAKADLQESIQVLESIDSKSYKVSWNEIIT